MLTENNHEKHLRRYLKITTFVFAIIGILHAVRLYKKWGVFIGDISIPLSLSWLAIFVALCMFLMGLMYLKK